MRIKLLINCYYYAPHNHSLLSEHLEADLGRMVELGVDIVSVCVQESQLLNWHQQRLRNVVDQAHRHGLMVHAVPNRWAGLVAGWLDGFGNFTAENLDTLVVDQNGKFVTGGEMVSCVNNPKVEEHIRYSLAQMFTLFDFDGLIWDEPHPRVCYCGHCAEANPRFYADWFNSNFADFLDRMSAQVKSLRGGVKISVFVQPDQGDLLECLLKANHIDYIGSDGHVRSEDHRMHRMKGTIFQAHQMFHQRVIAAGKKDFFLLEAQRHRDEDLENYLANVERAFQLPMDHLMFYYSAHEMSPDKEGVFNTATWDCVRKLAPDRL